MNDKTEGKDMKIVEDHIVSFHPDYTGDDVLRPHISLDLMDSVYPVSFHNFHLNDFTIDQTKQLIECLQAAVDKYKEINK